MIHIYVILHGFGGKGIMFTYTVNYSQVLLIPSARTQCTPLLSKPHQIILAQNNILVTKMIDQRQLSL